MSDYRRNNQSSGHDDRFNRSYSGDSYNNRSQYKVDNTRGGRRGRGRRGAGYNDNQGYRGGHKNRGSYSKYNGQETQGTYMDEDTNMGDGMNSGGAKQRFNPYGTQNRRGGRGYQKSRGNRGSRGGGGSYQSNRMLQTTDRTGALFPWFSVNIPFGKRTDKVSLMQTLSQAITRPLVPVQFSYIDESAVFYLQDKDTAQEVKDASRKITLPTGFKMLTVVKGCMGPNVFINKESTKHLEECLSRRYDPTAKALGLSDMVNDTVLKEKAVYLPLGKPQVLRSVVQLIGQHIPEITQLDFSSNKLFTLSSFTDLIKKAPSVNRLSLANNNITYESELDNLKGWNLDELSLEKNPVCDKFKSPDDYVRAIRKRFPKVLILDGTTLPPPITFDIENESSLPPHKGSHFPDAQVQELISAFLKQYISLFDNVDTRSQLIDAYHDQAMFSMTWSFNKAVEVKQVNFYSYNDLSHNLHMDRMRNGHKRVKTGKVNVVSMLSDLPRTEHDLSSLVVDVTCLTKSLLSFSVSGLFKEFRDSKEVVRHFSRLFVTIPQGSGIVIVNEQLSITNATPALTKTYKSGAGPSTPSHSAAVPSTSTPGTPSEASIQEKQQMVIQFSKDSGMNLKFSEDCLVQNGWDYAKSAAVFTDLKSKGAIPPEAYQQ